MGKIQKAAYNLIICVLYLTRKSYVRLYDGLLLCKDLWIENDAADEQLVNCDINGVTGEPGDR